MSGQALGPDTIWLFRRPHSGRTWVAARGVSPLGHLVAQMSTCMNWRIISAFWSDEDIAHSRAVDGLGANALLVPCLWLALTCWCLLRE